MDLDTCEETNEEIRTLFQDLGVLNKSDFKMLLKWRLQVRKRLGMEDKKKSTAANADEDERDKKKTATPEDENERLLSEMEELQGNMDAEARRKKKKQAKMKQKDRIRAQLGLKGDGEAIVAEEDLFSLVRLKTKVRWLLVAVIEARASVRSHVVLAIFSFSLFFVRVSLYSESQ
jgi:AdoMet-dependent rRNA methyltransferase SPB1